MVDKVIDEQEFLKQIKNGDTIAVGGWGPVRKPMALIRAIARSDLKDLTIISLAALDLDLLIGAGRLKRAIYAFVSLEGAPGKLGNFIRARKEATIETREISEGMFWAGLRAAAERLPFYPTRSGIGSDVLTVNPEIEIIEAPYTGEKLVAMPALKADVALIHVNAATPSGYGQIIGDPILDPILVRGAKKVFMSAEKIIPLKELKTDYPRIAILRPFVTGVIHAPCGAHPGSCYPNYGWDDKYLQEYGKSSADQESFNAYLTKYVTNVKNHDEYIKLVGGEERIAQIPV